MDRFVLKGMSKHGKAVEVTDPEITAEVAIWVAAHEQALVAGDDAPKWAVMGDPWPELLCFKEGSLTRKFFVVSSLPPRKNVINGKWKRIIPSEDIDNLYSLFEEHGRVVQVEPP